MKCNQPRPRFELGLQCLLHQERLLMYIRTYMSVYTYVHGCELTIISMYVCICVYPYTGHDVAVRILCTDHSSASPSLSGDGQIKLSHHLKDFNFLITLFIISWRSRIWQYSYVQSISGSRLGS